MYKSHTHMERAPFTGGTVLCPNPGVHYNVGMLDYASLYPNVMIGLNVSTQSLSVQMTDGGSFGQFKRDESLLA